MWTQCWILFFFLPFRVWFWSFLYDFLFVVQYLFSFCQRLRHLFLRPPSFSNLDDWWEFHHCWTTMVETHQKRSLHPPYCHQFLIRCQVFRLKKIRKKSWKCPLFASFTTILQDSLKLAGEIPISSVLSSVFDSNRYLD